LAWSGSAWTAPPQVAASKPTRMRGASADRLSSLSRSSRPTAASSSATSRRRVGESSSRLAIRLARASETTLSLCCVAASVRRSDRRTRARPTAHWVGGDAGGWSCHALPSSVLRRWPGLRCGGGDVQDPKHPGHRPGFIEHGHGGAPGPTQCGRGGQAAGSPATAGGRALLPFRRHDSRCTQRRRQHIGRVPAPRRG
jgi:hypothetical protein